MVLAVDIGNSNIVIGIWVEDQYQATWRLPTKKGEEAMKHHRELLAGFFSEWGYRYEMVKGVIIGSVVPDLTDDFEHLMRSMFDIPVVHFNLAAFQKLAIQTVAPQEIGADLVANAYAAFDKFRQHAVVADFGTALTFTTIDHNGAILGVAIAPGLKTAMGALFNKTAQLPEVILQYPDTVLGKDTVHAIRSGILIGYTGLVRHMLEAIQSEVGTACKFIATGGLSFALPPLRSVFDEYDPNLTVLGLKLAFDRLTLLSKEAG
jgi:type III pantothenate kinase